ncbi:MAG: hypothetical protein HQK87_04090 [Nitrospinae bacterium]|nr:hypothetical protein [Nitrospinota bacterium]
MFAQKMLSKITGLGILAILLVVAGCSGGGGGGGSNTASEPTLADEPWLGTWALDSVGGEDYRWAGVTLTFAQAGAQTRAGDPSDGSPTAFSGQYSLRIGNGPHFFTFATLVMMSSFSPSTLASQAYMEHNVSWSGASFSDHETSSNLSHRQNGYGQFKVNGEYLTYDLGTVMAYAYYREWFAAILTLVTGDAAAAEELADRILAANGALIFRKQ